MCDSGKIGPDCTSWTANSYIKFLWTSVNVLYYSYDTGLGVAAIVRSLKSDGKKKKKKKKRCLSCEFNVGTCALLLITTASTICVMWQIPTWLALTVFTTDPVIHEIRAFGYAMMSLQGGLQMAGLLAVVLSLIQVLRSIQSFKRTKNMLVRFKVFVITYGIVHFFLLFLAMSTGRGEVAGLLTFVANTIIAVLSGHVSRKMKTVSPKIFLVVSRICLSKSLILFATFGLGLGVSLSSGAIISFFFGFAFVVEAYWYLVAIRWLGGSDKNGKKKKKIQVAPASSTMSGNTASTINTASTNAASVATSQNFSHGGNSVIDANSNDRSGNASVINADSNYRSESKELKNSSLGEMVDPNHDANSSSSRKSSA